jgi:hypothetical protein
MPDLIRTCRLAANPAEVYVYVPNPPQADDFTRA